MELELELERGRPESVLCLVVDVCPEIEVDKPGMEDLKDNSFDSAVQPGDRWEPAVGMARVPRMDSSAWYCSRMGPIEDRLAVAVGKQALVASTVVGHWGQSARECMVGREVEEVNWTAGGEEIVSLGSGDEQKMSWTAGY